MNEKNNSVIGQLETLLDQTISGSQYYIKDKDGNMYTLIEASEKGISGLPVLVTSKKTVLKGIFGKERVTGNDFLKLDSLISKLLNFAFHNLSYSCKIKYFKSISLLDLLFKYKVDFTFPNKNKIQIDYEHEYPDQEITIEEFFNANKERYCNLENPLIVLKKRTRIKKRKFKVEKVAVA